MSPHHRANGDREWPPVPPTALQLINRQCGEHDGEWLDRIRVHPSDWPGLVDELRQSFDIPPYDIHALGGVPVVLDPSCTEGPVCDWRPAQLVTGRYA